MWVVKVHNPLFFTCVALKTFTLCLNISQYLSCVHTILLLLSERGVWHVTKGTGLKVWQHMVCVLTTRPPDTLSCFIFLPTIKNHHCQDLVIIQDLNLTCQLLSIHYHSCCYWCWHESWRVSWTAPSLLTASGSAPWTEPQWHCQ